MATISTCDKATTTTSLLTLINRDTQTSFWQSSPTSIESSLAISSSSLSTSSSSNPYNFQTNPFTQTSLQASQLSHSHPWNGITLSKPQVQCSTGCEHFPQCIIRQPRPPPFPSITFLHNQRSKYNKHMMEWSREEFKGCERCFSVENENYGCDKCVWLKWWYKWHGETHGYPDMDTKIYQKYL